MRRSIELILASTLLALAGCGGSGGSGGGGNSPQVPQGNLAIKYQAVTAVQGVDGGMSFPLVLMRRTAPPGSVIPKIVRPAANLTYLPGFNLYFAEQDSGNKITLNLYTDAGGSKSAGSMSITLNGLTNVSPSSYKYPLVCDLNANITGGNVPLSGLGKLTYLDSKGKNQLSGTINMPKNSAVAKFNMTLDDTSNIGGSVEVDQHGMTSVMTHLVGDFTGMTGDITVSPQGWTGKGTISLLSGAFSETLNIDGKTVVNGINMTGKLDIQYPDGTNETIDQPLSYTLGTTTGATVNNPTISVTWPARSRTLTGTSSALSVELILSGSTITVGNYTNVFNRNTNPAQHTETYTLPASFYVGSGPMKAEFFSGSDGGGDQVAVANGTVQYSGSGASVGSLTLVQSISKVTFPAPQLTVGQAPVPLTFQATDSSGATVGVTPGSAFWTLVSGTGVVSLTQDGVLTVLKSGTASVKATVDGVSSSVVTLTVSSTHAAFATPVPIPGSMGATITRVLSSGEMVGGDSNGAALYWSTPTAQPTKLKGLAGSTGDSAVSAAVVNGVTEIVGVSNGQPVVWKGPTSTPIALDTDVYGTGPYGGVATSVNSKGHIVGYQQNSFAYYWSTPTSKLSVIQGSKLGSGSAQPGQDTEPFLTDKDALTFFTQDGRPGFSVGASLSYTSQPYWAPGKSVDHYGIPSDLGRFSSLAGVTAGIDYTSTNHTFPIFYLESEKFNQEYSLPMLSGAMDGEAVTVGENGWIGGNSDGSVKAVLWKNATTVQDVNQLIPANSGWTLTNVYRIFPDGSLICNGIGGTYTGFAYLKRVGNP